MSKAAQRTKQNPLRVVKLADINDNMDLSRIHHQQVKDFERLNEYKQVRDILPKMFNNHVYTDLT